MPNNQEILSEQKAVQHEDAALKTMLQFFADEMLPTFGIEGKVKQLAPTEIVHLKIKKMYQDSNLIMEDGSWKHFEFQSRNEGVAGLRRFRTYEALTSQQYRVPITTYVLFSGNIKKPMTTLTEGINTYRIVPIIMRSKIADEIFKQLQEKSQKGIPLTKEDLVQLPLCPLMSGNMNIKERIKSAFSLVRAKTVLENEEISKIEAVIYAMAEKFLESADMKEIMEDVRMTKLGRMIYEEGEEQGKLEAAKKLLDILDERVIAERIGLPLETVQKMKEEFYNPKK